MTDTTNTMPPLPVHPYGQALWTWSASERRAIIAYGDARAAHAVAQIKARKVTDAEIDALLLDAIGFDRELGYFRREDVRHIARAAIALANGRG